MRGQIEEICRVFAANVQPIPNLHTTGLNKITQTASITQGAYTKEEKVLTEVSSLRWRSVCFYMNASYNDRALEIMNNFKEFMESKNAGQVSGVHTWITLGGAITTYVVKVAFLV